MGWKYGYADMSHKEWKRQLYMGVAVPPRDCSRCGAHRKMLKSKVVRGNMVTQCTRCGYKVHTYSDRNVRDKMPRTSRYGW